MHKPDVNATGIPASNPQLAAAGPIDRKSGARAPRAGRPSRLEFLTAALLFGLLLPIPYSPAWASAYVTETASGYTVRCSSVPSARLPQEVLNRYQVEPEPDTGVLSCVVQKAQDDGAYSNTKALVTAKITNLVGIDQQPQIREVLEGTNVTYLTTFEIPANGPLTFELVVKPAASDALIPLEFDDIRPAE